MNRRTYVRTCRCQGRVMSSCFEATSYLILAVTFLFTASSSDKGRYGLEAFVLV